MIPAILVLFCMALAIPIVATLLAPTAPGLWLDQPRDGHAAPGMSPQVV